MSSEILENSGLDISTITKLENANGITSDITSEMMFVQGFKMGVRLMIEAFDDSKTTL